MDTPLGAPSDTVLGLQAHVGPAPQFLLNPPPPTSTAARSFLILPLPKPLHFPPSSAPRCGFTQKFSPVNKYSSVLQNSPKAKHFSLLFSSLIASSSVFFPSNIILSLSQAGNNYIAGKRLFFFFPFFFLLIILAVVFCSFIIHLLRREGGE